MIFLSDINNVKSLGGDELMIDYSEKSNNVLLRKTIGL